MRPVVTVVVCTKDRFNLLAKCLASINDIAYPSTETIVIDSSASSLVASVKELVESCAGRYIRESQTGLCIARNRAIVASKGEIVAFLGDDCIVGPGWLDAIVENYTTGNVACVTGRIIPISAGERNIGGSFFNHDYGVNRRVVSRGSLLGMFQSLFSVAAATTPLGERAPLPWGIGAGDNMSFRKDIFKVVGLFDLNLWRRYPVEDLDMFIRVLNKGYRLVYEPKALVFHDYKLEGKATTMQDLAYMHGIGAGVLLLKYIADPYFFSVYFGRVLNVVYGTLRATLEKDPEYCTVRRKYLNGLLHALGLFVSQGF